MRRQGTTSRAPLAQCAARGQLGDVTRPSNLDDPEYAAFAWARYRRLMRWMGLVAVACVALVLTALYFETGDIGLGVVLMVAGGIGVSVMLMAALMGLVFLSSGTGHDEAIDDRLEQEIREHHDLP